LREEHVVDVRAGDSGASLWEEPDVSTSASIRAGGLVEQLEIRTMPSNEKGIKDQNWPQTVHLV